MIKNSAIYISDPSMLGSRLFDRSPDIISYETFENGETNIGFKLVLSWGEIVCHIMQEDQLEKHIAGYEAYMTSQIQDKEDLVYFLSRLHYVRTCLGLEISHKEGMEEDVHQFLFSLNEVLAGLLFMYDTTWDWSREALGGPLK
ncbi:hypothetical protein [Pleionea sp. CnH1-48]|uniref:hypothetical protein n=1 Tax=Pleionea sp. CnH1-48 TaxID=2954494 RepID=UPI0020975F1B|nr:hypothetical protein [Pleionea sp. CnH1-48]MCO7227580.1 hypothetical protein [Pleionea sp. CnH1-48]